MRVRSSNMHGNLSDPDGYVSDVLLLKSHASDPSDDRRHAGPGSSQAKASLKCKMEL
jgi:hypothetical protein